MTMTATIVNRGNRSSDELIIELLNDDGSVAETRSLLRRQHLSIDPQWFNRPMRLRVNTRDMANVYRGRPAMLLVETDAVAIDPGHNPSS